MRLFSMKINRYVSSTYKFFTSDTTNNTKKYKNNFPIQSVRAFRCQLLLLAKVYYFCVDWICQHPCITNKLHRMSQKTQKQPSLPSKHHLHQLFFFLYIMFYMNNPFHLTTPAPRIFYYIIIFRLSEQSTTKQFTQFSLVFHTHKQYRIHFIFSCRQQASKVTCVYLLKHSLSLYVYATTTTSDDSTRSLLKSHNVQYAASFNIVQV